MLVVAGAISLICSKFGLTVLPEDIAVVLTAVGVCVSWYGRWKKGDITFGGFRK